MNWAARPLPRRRAVFGSMNFERESFSSARIWFSFSRSTTRRRPQLAEIGDEHVGEALGERVVFRLARVVVEVRDGDASGARGGRGRRWRRRPQRGREEEGQGRHGAILASGRGRRQRMSDADVTPRLLDTRGRRKDDRRVTRPARLIALLIVVVLGFEGAPRAERPAAAKPGQADRRGPLLRLRRQESRARAAARGACADADHRPRRPARDPCRRARAPQGGPRGAQARGVGQGGRGVGGARRQAAGRAASSCSAASSTWRARCASTRASSRSRRGRSCARWA